MFIPDSSLQQLPWAALCNNGTFLCEKYTISISVGMSLNSPIKLNVDKPRTLIAGLTEGLPNVAHELEMINEQFPATTLIDQELTKGKLEFELRNHFYRIVHLATHADFTMNAQQNYLLTGKGKMDMNQLEQWIKMSSLRQDGIELLTLSACKTAVGDDINNMGLAGTAIRSGAKSVLASLWQVDDKATAMLMTDFYNNLKAGHSKAKALQKAQQSLLKDPTYSSPYYWAPFTLIGNWL